MPSFWSCEQCIYGETAPPPTRRPPAPKVVARFSARYDGHCDGCNLPIVVGQVIVRLDDDRYVHEGCGP